MRAARRTTIFLLVICVVGGFAASSAQALPYLSVRSAQHLIWRSLKDAGIGAHNIYSGDCRRFARNSVNCYVILTVETERVMCGRMTVWLAGGPYYGQRNNIRFC